jgi:hypothetical protein
MLGTIIAAATLGLAYIFLRAQGGKGADISFKVRPYSTRDGKVMRLKLIGILLLLTGAALVNVFLNNNNRTGEYLLLFIYFGGTGISLGAYFLAKSKSR